MKCGDRRFRALLDSRVAKGAHAKGLSSANALRPALQRSCSYAIAGNLHPALGFAPTRINTADAPTRQRPLPPPADFSIFDFLTQIQIAALHSCQFSRAVSGWVRLFILVTFCLCPGEGCKLPDSSNLLNLWIWNFSTIDFSSQLRPWTCLHQLDHLLDFPLRTPGSAE